MQERQFNIGLHSYSLFVLEHYWRHLSGENRCIWAVSNSILFQELKKRGISDVAFRDSFLSPVFPKVVRKASNVLLSKLRRSHIDFKKKLIDDVSPDFWITDTTLVMLKYKIDVPKILVFHSVPIKRYYFMPESLAYDLVLLPGNYHYQEMLKRFPQAKGKNLEVVGWPRHDDLVLGRFDKKQVLSELGLEQNKHTILYAPTWDANFNGKLFPACFSEDSFVLTELGKFIGKNDLNLIVKVHQAHTQMIGNGKLQAIAEDYGIYWTPKTHKGFIEDPNPYLVAADVLISDISGISMDYLVLDRPMIFVDPDDPGCWEESDIPRDWRPGPVARDLAGLFDAIENALLAPEKGSDERCALAEKLFLACDGESGRRAASAVLNFANRCVATN